MKTSMIFPFQSCSKLISFKFNWNLVRFYLQTFRFGGRFIHFPSSQPKGKCWHFDTISIDFEDNFIFLLNHSNFRRNLFDGRPRPSVRLEGRRCNFQRQMSEQCSGGCHSVDHFDPQRGFSDWLSLGVHFRFYFNLTPINFTEISLNSKQIQWKCQIIDKITCRQWNAPLLTSTGQCRDLEAVASSLSSCCWCDYNFWSETRREGKVWLTTKSQFPVISALTEWHSNSKKLPSIF